MNIAVYGGAFDPIHRSHVLLADVVSTHFDQVWIMPCFQHRFGKETAPHDLRLKFCQLSTCHNPKLYVSNFEIENGCNNGTLDVLTRLSKAFPEHQFSFCIGQDNADEIHKWLNYEILLKRYPAVVLPRGTTGEKGQVDESAWYRQKPHLFLDFTIPNMSSTQIRQAIAENTCHPAYFQNKQVYDAVIESGYYKG